MTEASSTDRQAGDVAFVELGRSLTTLLHEHDAHPEWIDALQAVGRGVVEITERTADAVLFALFQRAGRVCRNYSSEHALACAALAALAIGPMGRPPADRDALVHAALTMNLGMTALQDELVWRERTPTLDQRLAIDAHPARSVALLERLGVDDPLWLGIVAHHHRQPDPQEAPDELGRAEYLATLLARIDVFLAKLSPRVARKAMPATSAAREACLGPNGLPDRWGSAILRAVGLYPPGTCVRLANGEVAVVLRRGARADQPLVASVTSAQRQPLAQPLLRRTADPALAVRGVARAQEVRLGFDPALLSAALPAEAPERAPA